LSWSSAKWGLFGFALIELTVSDFESRILPDEFTLGGWIAGIALAYAAPLPGDQREITYLLFAPASDRMGGLIEAAFGSLALAGLLWATGWAYMKVRKREGLGLGDVKLLGMMTAFLGLETSIATLLAASLGGSIIGLIWIRWKGEDAATFELPLGSFLGAAGLIAVVLKGIHPGLS
jgi:leader peptidase (prepilin peptidase)/N-methyltransferase